MYANADGKTENNWEHDMGEVILIGLLLSFILGFTGLLSLIH